MAGIFRFSNAVSNIDGILRTYSQLYNHFEGQIFNHEQAAEFLALNGLASSLGAIGRAALTRSTRPDKSRDPLYNQHKSYSEMFRMLGWYEPCESRTSFRMSEYGYYIANNVNNPTIIKKLVALNILHIVSPNPLTTVKGYNILRPFSFLLKLMLALDGIISRDELILGVLACPDDTNPSALMDAAQKIARIRRKGILELNDNIDLLRDTFGINSEATLANYTRFPIAVMKWTGWAESVSVKDLYSDKAIKMLSLTDCGVKLAKFLMNIPDVRYEDIADFPNDEICAFIALSNLTKLKSVGFNLEAYKNVLPVLREFAKGIYSSYNIIDDAYLFFGYQEASREMLKSTDTLLESLLS